MRSVLAGLALMLSGCTVIEIAESDGAVHIERRMGFASITLDPSGEAVVASMRSLGAASTPLGFTLGYAAQQLAVLGEDCRVVFWVKSEHQATALKGLASTLNDACLVKSHRGHNR
jgi:hypothetical protein